jgi:hypothetical protein
LATNAALLLHARVRGLITCLKSLQNAKKLGVLRA